MVSHFCRELAGFLRVVRDSICDGDACACDFGCERREYLYGAISWLTLLMRYAADIERDGDRDCAFQYAEPTICSQRKPSSLRCSAQSTGRCADRRINLLAVSCGGLRPFTMAAVMSGASQGSLKTE